MPISATWRYVPVQEEGTPKTLPYVAVQKALAFIQMLDVLAMKMHVRSICVKALVGP